MSSITFTLERSTATKEHHLKDGSFCNPWPSYIEYTRSLAFPLKLLREMDRKPLPPKEDLVPVVEPNFTIGSKEQIKATWLGHASFLLELPSQKEGARGVRVLFDPILSHRCSPSSFVGPSRITPQPLSISDLAKLEVDIICISHNHYDHLDIPTLKAIIKAQEKTRPVQIFVPLKVSPTFKGLSENVTEMDWWDSASIETPEGSIKLTCTPSQHASGRGIFDHQFSLWSSWVVEGHNSKVYFAGDTGYRTCETKKPATRDPDLPVCPAFKAIGQKFGGFDLAFIPIGAYEPTHLFSPMHASPEDAVEIHKDVRSLKSIGMHYGTYVLTDELFDEPPKRLKTAMKERGLGENAFICIDIGATTCIVPQ